MRINYRLYKEKIFVFELICVFFKVSLPRNQQYKFFVIRHRHPFFNKSMHTSEFPTIFIFSDCFIA